MAALLTVIFAFEFTVTTTVSVASQLVVTVTTYVVVTAGFAIGCGQFVQLSPVAGDQLKVELTGPVLPQPNVVLSPQLTVISGPAFAQAAFTLADGIRVALR
jgi:hypothetical protein